MIEFYFIERLKTNSLTYFRVTGHADSAPYGSDLVCAGVSAIVFGFVAYLENNFAKSITTKIDKKNNFVEVKINARHNDINIAFRLVSEQIKLLKKKYPRKIAIKKEKWND